MTHRYLVGYMTTRGGFGAAEISLKYPVRDMRDIAVLTDILRAQVHIDDPIVTGFSRFEEAAR